MSVSVARRILTFLPHSETMSTYHTILTPAAAASSSSMHNIMATTIPIHYHSTESRNLLRVTTDGLLSNGIDIDRFGAQRHGKYILCGGLKLTAHAAEQLHPSMGGCGDESTAHMDPKTVSFMSRANLASPAGYKGPPREDSGERYSSRTPWHDHAARMHPPSASATRSRPIVSTITGAFGNEEHAARSASGMSKDVSTGRHEHESSRSADGMSKDVSADRRGRSSSRSTDGRSKEVSTG